MSYKKCYIHLGRLFYKYNKIISKYLTTIHEIIYVNNIEKSGERPKGVRRISFIFRRSGRRPLLYKMGVLNEKRCNDSKKKCFIQQYVITNIFI